MSPNENRKKPLFWPWWSWNIQLQKGLILACMYTDCSETELISATVSWWQKVVSQHTQYMVVKLSFKGLVLWHILLLTVQPVDWPSLRGHTCKVAQLLVSLTTTHGLVPNSPLTSIVWQHQCITYTLNVAHRIFVCSVSCCWAFVTSVGQICNGCAIWICLWVHLHAVCVFIHFIL